MTFKDWWALFHKAYCEDVIAWDKSQDYKYIYEKHFKVLDNKEMDDIKPIDIISALKSTFKMSSDRQRTAYFLIKRVFREGIVNEVCNSNPVIYVKVPKKVRKDVEYFDTESLQKLFDCDTKISRMFELDLWTGLRRGELLALHWDNIDLDKGYIKICQTLVHTKNGDIIKQTTKSRKDRLIPLHPEAKAILKRIRSQDCENGFLFTSEVTGKLISLRQYNRLYRAFYSAQREKYPDLIFLSPHNLRHSFATYILQSGGDIETLRALLGHVDISTTQRYVHSNYSQMKKAVENLKFE